MSHENISPLKTHEGRISQSFEVNANFEYPFYSQLKVGDNARSQIDNEISRQHKIEQHDYKWKLERDKLSNSSVPFPSNDLGSREHRSLQHEYEERRTNWEYELSTIETKHNDNKTFIRDNGQTLAKEFSAKNPGNGIYQATDEFHVEKQEEKQKEPLQEEFSVQSQGELEQDFAVSKDSRPLTKTL